MSVLDDLFAARDRYTGSTESNTALRAADAMVRAINALENVRSEFENEPDTEQDHRETYTFTIDDVNEIKPG